MWISFLVWRDHRQASSDGLLASISVCLRHFSSASSATIFFWSAIKLELITPLHNWKQGNHWLTRIANSHTRQGYFYTLIAEVWMSDYLLRFEWVITCCAFAGLYIFVSITMGSECTVMSLGSFFTCTSFCEADTGHRVSDSSDWLWVEQLSKSSSSRLIICWMNSWVYHDVTIFNFPLAKADQMMAWPHIKNWASRN